MTYLLDLPPEVVINIIQAVSKLRYSWLEYGWEPMNTELYPLARTCRTLFHITEPFLYTKYVQYDNPTQISKFLRTILEKPKYASKVKRMCIEQMVEMENDDHEDELKEQELALLTKACERYGLQRLSLDQWMSAPATRRFQDLVAIVTLMLPNLEDMYMDPIPHVNSGFFSKAITSSFPSSNRFLSKLQKIKFVHRENRGVYLEDICCFFYLPSIRKFDIDHLCAQNFTWSRPLSCCSVEQLDLSWSGIGNEALSTLLRPMLNLKILSCVRGPTHFENFMVPTLPGLGQALTLVRDSLEYLVLDEFYYQPEDEGLLGSLRNFPRLKDIIVPISVLIGAEHHRAEKELWEMLPSAVERIIFHGTGGFACDGMSGGTVNRSDTFYEIVDMVRKKESHFPSLKRIGLGSFEEHFTVQDFAALREVCVARGVEFSPPFRGLSSTQGTQIA